jgi:hypothetical protein
MSHYESKHKQGHAAIRAATISPSDRTLILLYNWNILGLVPVMIGSHLESSPDWTVLFPFLSRKPNWDKK